MTANLLSSLAALRSLAARGWTDDLRTMAYEISEALVGAGQTYLAAELRAELFRNLATVAVL